MKHAHLEKSGRTFPVSRDFLRQYTVYREKRADKVLIVLSLFHDFRVFRQTIGQQQHRIIGRGVSVHRDHIIGICNDCGKCLLQQWL